MTHADGPHVAVVGLYLDRVVGAPNLGCAAAAARHAGVRVTIVQAAWEDAELDIEGVPCCFVRERGDPFLRLPGVGALRRRPQRLLERAAALAPDVIHLEGLVLPREVRALAAALPAVPIIAQDHGTKCPRGWRRWWYRWGFTPFAAAAFTARAQAQPFVAAGILRPDLPIFEVVELTSAFTPGDQLAARSATGLDGNPCLLWAGNLDANKDPLTVLDAVSQAAPGLPDLRLYMCFRQAPLVEAVRARIATDAALAGRVRLLGAVPHRSMETHYRAADFLVQASHAEGSGGALIDALACGTTPLVTDIPSFRRITGEGEFGGLVPVDDAAALAATIRAWSSRDRSDLRRRARAHFERAMSLDAIGSQLRVAYDALRVSR